MQTSPQVVFQKAVAEYNANRNENVASLLKPIIKSKQATPEVHNLLAASMTRLGKNRDASKQLKTALKLDPKNAQAHFLLGNLYRDEDRQTLAIKHYEKAFSLDKRNPRPLMEIGLSLQQKESWSEAEPYFDRFLAAGGDPLEGHIRKAVCRYSLYDYDAAQQMLDKARAINAELDIVRYYQAMIFDKTRRKSEAEHIFLDLIQKGHTPSLFSLSLLYFSIGEWEKAFSYYDNRPVAKNLAIQCRQLDVPVWQGESLKGKRIFIKGEQGLGDQIRYLLFLPKIVNQAAKVSLHCDARLYPLVQSTFPSVECIAAKTWRPELISHVKPDYAVCIGSLGKQYAEDMPARYQTQNQSMPFIQPSVDRVSEMAGKYLPDNGKPNIGLSWRSIRLMRERTDWYLTAVDMAQICAGLDANIVSLQYNLSDEERAAFEVAGISLVEPEDLDLKDDQEGLAALIANLDWVLSVSTALTELAGAVGTPTMNFAVNNVRWFMAEPHVRGFYPNMRVYTKDIFADWDEVIAAARLDLLSELGR